MRVDRLLGIAVALVAGCGDATAPKTPELTGTWTYNVFDFVAVGISCSMYNSTLVVNLVGKFGAAEN